MIVADMQTLYNGYIWQIKCIYMFPAYDILFRHINFKKTPVDTNVAVKISFSIYHGDMYKNRFALK